MPDDTTFYRSRPHAPTDLARPMGLCVHSVGWFRCRPDYRVSRTSWYGFHLFYVRGGRGWVVRRGRTWSAEAGDVVALDLSEAHQYFADPWDPWEFLWVHFSGSLAGEYMRLLGADEGPVLRPPKGSRGTGTGAGAGIERRETEDPGTGAGEGAAGPAPEAHLDRWFQRLYDLFEQHTLAEDARAASLLTRILTELLVARLQAGIPPGNPAADPTYPAAVRSGIAFLQNNFHRPLTLDEIARQGRLSPFHFARVFKRATGCSVMEYLMRLRMEQAKHLLAETELPVREVAEKVGMPDQSYFSKLFKRHVQKTPTEFRESSRRSGSG